MDEKIEARQEEIETLQQESKNEQLEKAAAFEELTRFGGWKLITNYYANAVQSFTNRVILQGFENIEDLNLERGKILGLKQLLSEVDRLLRILDDERKRTTANQ